MNDGVLKTGVGRRVTFLVQYLLVGFALYVGYRYLYGVAHGYNEVIYAASYVAIFPVLLQLVPIGIRCWIEWKFSWGTVFGLSVQFVFATYLAFVHFASFHKEDVAALFYLVFMGFSVAFVIFSAYKILAKAVENMMNLIFEQYEFELHRIR